MLIFERYTVVVVKFKFMASMGRRGEAWEHINAGPRRAPPKLLSTVPPPPQTLHIQQNTPTWFPRILQTHFETQLLSSKIYSNPIPPQISPKRSSRTFRPSSVRTPHSKRYVASSDAFRPLLRVFQIPSLDVQRPPSSYRDRSLVRFRAMVQDTSPSSEMYLRKTSTGAVAGWGIHEEIASEDSHALDYADLRECAVMWAVSVPGEAQWVSEELDDRSSGVSLLLLAAATFSQILDRTTYRRVPGSQDVQISGR